MLQCHFGFFSVAENNGIRYISPTSLSTSFHEQNHGDIRTFPG